MKYNYCFLLLGVFFLLIMACSNEFDPLSETMFDSETDTITEPDNDSNFFLNSNGITIMCPDTSPGETGIVEDVEYESVDRALLIQRRDEGADLTKVCTSLVTDMSELFREIDFNQSIGNWDVSNVTTMFGMFISSNFNQPISQWDVSTVEDMARLFEDTSFNQPINNWDVGKVTEMRRMFAESMFNQPINNWNVSNVQTMFRMFYNSAFNQPIGNWDVQNVTNMSEMFRDSNFNQPIGNWNVSSVTNMFGMFINSQFNHPISLWSVGNVEDMTRLFEESSFNQPIGNWDVSKVTTMRRMFAGSPFNQPIGNWDVRNVTTMMGMFSNSNFNQSLHKWCVLNIVQEPDDFSTGSPLTIRNSPVWGVCPNRSFSCGDQITFYYSGSQVTYGTVESANGRCWLDRNLGASRAATSSRDLQAYGDLFQWGRAADGHQRRDSPTITILSNSDQPDHGEFILSPDSPNDWRIPQNNNLWQGEDGINNPCPKDYRLPSETEWKVEIDSWNIQHGTDVASMEAAINSPLKLPFSGRRGRLAGVLYGAGSYGRYWSSTVSGTGSQVLRIEDNDIFWVSNFRAGAFSVRCIKDE